MKEPRPSSKGMWPWLSTVTKAVMPRNGCVRCWSRNKSSASKRWHMALKEWSTWPCSVVVNSICKQEPDKCRILIQQHRREAQGKLHSLGRLHHYCFSHAVRVKRDHRLLVAIFKKVVASLLNRLQRILLWIHKYNIRIL